MTAMSEREYPILDKINSPADVKNLNEEEIVILSDEIRKFLIENVSVTGGHLASNLGVVELTIALHRVFDSPNDKIVWDVGHQSYIHKLLTGRRGDFSKLRQPGGLSGFTKRAESVHDPFGAGHSSTSISAALGIAEAERIKKSGAYTVAIVGDGAFTGGMIHEALNNCEEKKDLKLIIIINENEMSISKNIGSFASSISKIRTRPSYFRTKDATKGVLAHIPLIGKPLLKWITNLKKQLKNILYGSNYFENLGLYYIGPIDGNDEKKVESMLREAKRCRENVVIHLKTVKGKGYEPAEKNPGKYHSVSPAGKTKKNGFSDTFGEELCRIASQDERVCAITAAMSDGTGLDVFAEKFPDKFFDVGIAEEHAATFAAGLASQGMKPVFAVYSTFLQRSYDNVVHDVALQKLPVVFAIDRAGLNSGDGATHHGIFDVAFLSEIPDIKIYTPATYDVFRICMREALDSGKPCAVRYPSGEESDKVKSVFYRESLPVRPGIRTCNTDGAEVIIAVHGRMAATALEVAEHLKNNGVRCGIILCEFIKPYKELVDLISGVLPDSDVRFYTLEEEIRAGGFGMNLCDAMSEYHPRTNCRYRVIAAREGWAIPAEGGSVFTAAGTDADTVYNIITEE